MAQASSYPSKATPIGADELLLLDSEAANAIKRAKLLTDVAWTPVLSSTGTAPTLTYTDRAARSIRIGNLVYLHCYIYVGNISAVGTGNIKVTGVPVASNNFCSLSLGLSNILNPTAQVIPWVTGNELRFWYAGSADVPVSALRTGVGGYLVCTGFYHV